MNKKIITKLFKINNWLLGVLLIVDLGVVATFPFFDYDLKTSFGLAIFSYFIIPYLLLYFIFCFLGTRKFKSDILKDFIIVFNLFINLLPIFLFLSLYHNELPIKSFIEISCIVLSLIFVTNIVYYLKKNNVL